MPVGFQEPVAVSVQVSLADQVPVSLASQVPVPVGVQVLSSVQVPVSDASGVQESVSGVQVGAGAQVVALPRRRVEVAPEPESSEAVYGSPVGAVPGVSLVRVLESELSSVLEFSFQVEVPESSASSVAEGDQLLAVGVGSLPESAVFESGVEASASCQCWTGEEETYQSPT